MQNRFDQDAPTWDDKSHRVKLAAEIAESIRHAVRISQDMDILDFGCGTGLVSLGLAEEVRSLTGLDSSAGMLEVFRDKAVGMGLTNVSALHLDLAGGDKLPGSYHLIISSMTFHHLEDVPAMARILADALHPGGTLCIADLDPDHGHFHSDNTGVHHFGFDREYMIDYFRSAGLSKIISKDATTMTRTGKDGVEREFTVFLVAGTKL